MGLPRYKLTFSELGVNLGPGGVEIDPFISTLGVNLALNTVNMLGIPLYFHSRHGFGPLLLGTKVGSC